MIAADAALSVAHRRPGERDDVGENITVRRSDADGGGCGRRRHVVKFQVLRLEWRGAPARVAGRHGIERNVNAVRQDIAAGNAAGAAVPQPVIAAVWVRAEIGGDVFHIVNPRRLDAEQV